VVVDQQYPRPLRSRIPHPHLHPWSGLPAAAVMESTRAAPVIRPKG
jgi:hypothetical protein